MRYEAKDVKNGVIVYCGESKAGFILTVIEYIESQRREQLNLISEEDVMRLNVKALERVGIKISMKNEVQKRSLKFA